VIHDWTAAIYQKHKAVSASLLKRVRKGAPHYHAPTSVGDAAHLGTAAHALTLDAGEFDREVAVQPEINRRTKEGRAQYAEWLESVGDRAVITQKQHDTARRMRDAVLAHPYAGPLLLGARTEISMAWNADGQDRKARVDAVCGDVLVDLKTTRDAGPAYARGIFRYDVHMQLAWYADALALHEMPTNYWMIVAVDSVEPHGVAVYQLPPLALDKGREAYQSALEKLRAMGPREHGYGAEPIMVEVPKWI
jgi:exodeoxyribonuclease VIII